MTPDDDKAMPTQIIHLVAARLKRAYDVTAAADCCASGGNQEGAFRILLDVDQDLFEATNLLNALTVIRHEQRG